ncbi:hypothetical protein WICMUC_003226 [Wickerhamomyces mucosus]|uniref:RRM domain-containing protein n=1 Tax=Wickerhamomyces mucosus TaxID=1378264 RepID=A0A9P8PNP8_9ASCO|nr:hypothetical protein WICMUC_003226 [Wickerhamomyces mucosus]
MNPNNKQRQLHSQQWQQYPTYYSHNYPQPPNTAEIPQSPFDLAYGSSLLPRQLLVSSPMVSINPSPLPSPIHHPGHVHIHQGRPGLSYHRNNSTNSINNHHNHNHHYHNNNDLYNIGPPKLNMSSENLRFKRNPNLKKRIPKILDDGNNPTTISSIINDDDNNSNNHNNNNNNDENDDEEDDEDDYESINTPSKIIPKSKVSKISNSSSSNNSSIDLVELNSRKSSLFQSSSNSSIFLPNSDSIQISKLPTRSIILLNVNKDLSISKFLDFIAFGPLGNIRILENYPQSTTILTSSSSLASASSTTTTPPPLTANSIPTTTTTKSSSRGSPATATNTTTTTTTNSIILTFYKVETCLNFYNNILTYFANFKKFINSPQLKLNFLITPKINNFISNAINNDGATRNVYIGNLNELDLSNESKRDDGITEEFLMKKLSKFGIIEKIDLISKPIPKNKLKEKDNSTNKDQVQQSAIESESKEDNVVEKCAFIHFLSVSSSIKCVEQLNLIEFWSTCKIFYGTDRCSLQHDSLLKSLTDESNDDEEINPIYAEDDYFKETNYRPLQNIDQFHPEDSLEELDELDSTIHYYEPQNDYFIQPQTFFQPTRIPGQYLSHEQQNKIFDYNNKNKSNYNNISNNNLANTLNQTTLNSINFASLTGPENIGNRTICLINLDSSTKVENICNIIRGGKLQSIKFLQEKKVCFVTFIDPNSAVEFFANSIIDPLRIQGKKLRIGWGQHSGALPNSIGLAVTIGASRNLYIGVQDDDSDEILPEEEQLRKDFDKFGDIEQINYFKQKRCVFLNFLNISNSIRIVNEVTDDFEKFHRIFDGRYKNFKISYGKDRCGNPPKLKKVKRKNKGKKFQGGNNEIEQNNDEEEPILDHEIYDELASLKLNGKIQNAFGIIETVSDENIVDDKPNDSRKHNDDLLAFEDTINKDDNQKQEKHKEFQQGEGNKKDELEEITTQEDETYVSDVSSQSSGLNVITQAPSPALEMYTPARNSSTSTKVAQKRHNNKSKSKNYQHKNSFRQISRGSSQVSLTNYHEFYQAQQHFDYYYNAPPNIISQQIPPPFSRKNSSSNRPSIPRNKSHHNTNNYMTNGSEVMAQYLAQSQQSNLIYAANVFNSTDSNGNGGHF